MFKREIKNQLEALFDQVDKDQLFLPENGSKKPRFLCYYNLNILLTCPEYHEQVINTWNFMLS